VFIILWYNCINLWYNQSNQPNRLFYLSLSVTLTDVFQFGPFNHHQETDIRSGDDSMVNIGFHKGEWCFLSSSFCQEGYCSNCMIFLEKMISDGTVVVQKQEDNTESKDLVLTES
jgi:hypothetical protein